MNIKQKTLGKSYKFLSIGLVIVLLMAMISVSAAAAVATGPFTLEYFAGSNGYLSGETWQVVEYGDNGTPVEAIPDTLYHFVDWSDGLTDNPRTDTNVVDNITVTANFAIDTFTLRYTAGANGTLSGDTTQTVDIWADGTAVTAIADTGYRFVSWSDGSIDNPRTDYEVASDIDVTANFAFLYTVSFDSQGGSTVPDQLVASGGMVDYPVAPTKAGLYFAGWYKEATCDNIWHTRTDLISSNATLYAKWNATAPKVAVLYGSGSMVADINAKLVSTGFFSQIDLISLYDETPSASILKQYHVVMLYSDTASTPAPDAWGDALADYVDYGGGVVLTAFTFPVSNGSVGIDGRINADGYSPFIWDSSSHSDDYLTLVADAAADPILNGVNHFNGGESSFNCPVNLTLDANLIAHWSNEVPLVATKQLTDKGRIVGLNLYPPSSDARSDLWDSSTDGALLMANALLWAASTGEPISPPTITSNGGGSTASVYAEENQTAVTTVTATDPDSTTLTFSIFGGIDAALFTIDPSTGVLTFKTAPNFEYPADYYRKNTYRVTVQVSDGELTDAQEICVTVTDVNDAPAITSNSGGTVAYVDVKEEQTAVITMTASDPDGDTLTYSISGGVDADLFMIDSATGVLTFKTAPDYETPIDYNSDGTYEVTVDVSDGALADTQTINVTVTLLTPVDLLNALRSDVLMLESEGKISSSTANGLVRNIDKAIVKINAGDFAGALKLLNSMKKKIDRQIPRKIAASDVADVLVQIDLIISKIII